MKTKKTQFIDMHTFYGKQYNISYITFEANQTLEYSLIIRPYALLNEAEYKE